MSGLTNVYSDSRRTRSIALSSDWARAVNTRGWVKADDGSLKTSALHHVYVSIYVHNNTTNNMQQLHVHVHDDNMPLTCLNMYKLCNIKYSRIHEELLILYFELTQRVRWVHI